MADPNEMTFLQHLEELRWRILKCLAAIVIFAILAFIKADWLISFLTAPALRLNEPVILQALKVSDMFMVQLIASLMTGLVLASPVVIYQIWRFVEPAMGRSSRRTTLSVVIFGSFFLLAGVSFGYLILLPFSLRFFTSLGRDMVEANYSIHAYLGYVVWMLLAAGMVFQLPVISFILTRIGLLTPVFLRRYRKFALIGILVFAAILTPPDPMSQMFMAVPLLLLYELSIFISKIFSIEESSQDESDENNGDRSEES
ncbi:MAG: twin-arginine translocase subunit TatC [Fidelibacterota bacterium]|nr:MAG: twin-arginine translocase subunit TatC [Candidatus Neomarinimicrobiota bacterium]